MENDPDLAAVPKVKTDPDPIVIPKVKADPNPTAVPYEAVKASGSEQPQLCTGQKFKNDW